MRAVVWATVGSMVVLLATGVWLVMAYEPGMAVVPTVHRLAAFASIAGIVGLLGWALPGTAVARSWIGGALLVAVSLAGVTTGFELRWDQLALDTVGPVPSFRCVGALFDDRVVFFLRGIREVSKSEMQRQFFLHVAVVPMLVAMAARLVLRRRVGGGADVSATM